MTIPASMPVRAAYIGDGVTVNFSVPFVYFENQDGTKQIKVMLADSNGLNEVEQIENIDFTITAGGINGTLTMNIAPASGYKLTIVYNIPIEQLTDYKEFGRLPSKSIEAAFDKVTAILKQLQERIDRCVQISISSDGNPSEIFRKFLNDVAEIIETAQASKEDAEAAATSASESATAAQNYAENVKFGLKREAIVTSDWTTSGGKYKIFFADVGIIAAVYKQNGNIYELMTNIDVESSDSGTTITALAPFDGFCLIASSVNQQYVYRQTNPSNHWIINHNLGKRPHVQCVDDEGVVMAGTYKHINLNTLHVFFETDVSGEALLD